MSQTAQKLRLTVLTVLMLVSAGIAMPGQALASPAAPPSALAQLDNTDPRPVSTWAPLCITTTLAPSWKASCPASGSFPSQNYLQKWIDKATALTDGILLDLSEQGYPLELAQTGLVPQVMSTDNGITSVAVVWYVKSLDLASKYISDPTSRLYVIFDARKSEPRGNGYSTMPDSNRAIYAGYKSMLVRDTGDVLSSPATTTYIWTVLMGFVKADGTYDRAPKYSDETTVTATATFKVLECAGITFVFAILQSAANWFWSDATSNANYTDRERAVRMVWTGIFLALTVAAGEAAPGICYAIEESTL